MTYCQVFGSVRTQAGKKYIMIFRILPVEDPNVITTHILEVIHTPLKLQQIEKMVIFLLLIFVNFTPIWLQRWHDLIAFNISSEIFFFFFIKITNLFIDVSCANQNCVTVIRHSFLFLARSLASLTSILLRRLFCVSPAAQARLTKLV